MQITLHTGPHVEGGQPMTEHLQAVVNTALHRFGEKVTRVEAHLSDANSTSRTGHADVHCTLEAHIVGLDPVVAKEQADTAHQAIDGAVRKLKRVVGAAIGKHDPRSGRQPADPASGAGESADDPD
jgi:ribosomal subunit interface protein